VAWSVQAAVLVWASFDLRIWQLRVFSLGVLAALVVRLLAFDTPLDDLGDFRIIFNYRMLTFASAISALYGAAWLVRRGDDQLKEHQGAEQEDDRPFGSRVAHSRFLFPALLLGANFLTLWILSAEVISTVDSDIVDLSRKEHITSLSLSLLWALYASVVLTVGIIRRWQPVRLGGLVLLAIPVAKLFLVDTFDLEQGFRVAAYLSLGFILLIGGFLYQRFSETIKEFLFEEETASQH
jgi:hypothetical protein